VAEENLGTAVLSIVVDSKGLEESLNKAKQQIQKTSQELQRSLTAAPVNPATGKTYAQERALKVALGISKELLETDLKREQTLRRISQRILESAKISQGGFGEFSSTIGGDATARAIRRNQDKKAREEAARQADLQAQRDRSSERRAQTRSLQTAGGGGGLTSFLRDIRQREEGEKRVAAERIKGYKDAQFAEKVLQVGTEKRAAAEARAAVRTDKIKKRVGDAVSSGLIGGGFPLLFGQGPGAAAGGLVGGLGGGALGGGFGFGASIVGTILGSVVDEALNKGKALAAAFDDPIGKFSELQQAALLSSTAVEKNISALIEQGRNAEAAALIQLDIAQRFGDTGELDNLRNAYDDLGRAFSQLSVITAKYVAGPLSDFISKLASSFQASSSKELFNERLAGASTEVQTEARARVRSAAAELSGSGLSLAEVANKAYQEGLNLLDERLGKTKEVQAAEQALATAKQRQNKLDSLTTQQIQAQVQGYDLLNLQLEKQRIETQKLQDLQAAPPDKAEGINRKALQDTVRIDADINKLLQDRAAQRGLDEAQDKIKLQSIGRQIAATQALGKAERGVARDTLATVQGIQAGIAAAKDREREIGAQIDAARLRGGDADEQEAFRLVSQQQIAAQETRLELERGALALKEAGEKLRDDLRNAVLDFTRVRSDAQGLNKFLNPQQQDQRARQDFQLLLPQFREAQGLFQQLTGARAPEFSGPTASVNESIRDFIQRTQTESQATKNLVGTQQALATNLEAYNNTVAQLAAVTQTLADKNWAVNVAVSGGQAAISGDVLNGAISP
jgi:hypothetical protein